MKGLEKTGSFSPTAFVSNLSEIEIRQPDTEAFHEEERIMNIEDRELIDLFNRRDQRAIEAVSQKYGALCISVAKNILGSYQDAEECLNEALWKAWDSIPPNNPKLLSAFLVKITKNTAINKYRAMHREKRGSGEIGMVWEETEDFVFAGGSVEEDAERREILSAVNGFLEKLPSKKRKIFVRRYWYCDSVSKIAADYGITENNVSVTLNRTREALKKHLQKRGFLL